VWFVCLRGLSCARARAQCVYEKQPSAYHAALARLANTSNHSGWPAEWPLLSHLQTDGILSEWWLSHGAPFEALMHTRGSTNNGVCVSYSQEDGVIFPSHPRHAPHCPAPSLALTSEVMLSITRTANDTVQVLQVSQSSYV
jgi:hypothetical protein